MNKTAIKNFAVWARRKLISDAMAKAAMIGITDEGIANALPQSTSGVQFFDIGTKNYAEVSGAEIKQRKALVDAIRAKEKDSNYKTAFQNVIEEVAYTWFNRLIAVRFMEVNDYLPSGVRVLSSESEGKLEPDFVTSPFDTDLEFTPYEKDVVYQLKDENRLDELFRMLFIKQCNKLHDNLPILFEDTEDYSELLLTISFTDKDGVIYHLTHDISEDDFNVEKEGQVEIIGWLYQFYNIEPKEKVFSRKSGTRMKKEDIPAATQLFTPDWIVRYMVENSLGRLWLDGHPDDFLKSNWRYYLDEAEQEPDVKVQLDVIKKEHSRINPEEIKVIDPCMGSGHILVYIFDILIQIYENYGYTSKDAAVSILKNNLYGLDIDDRAAQLAYFAVMMKARQYNRRIMNLDIAPNLMSIQDSSAITENMIAYIGRHGSKKAESELTKIVDIFKDAKEIGSALILPKIDFASVDEAIEKTLNSETSDLLGFAYRQTIADNLIPIIKLAKILSQKYDAVITNPPYMAPNTCGAALENYVKKNYPDSKSDMFAVFIEKCGEMLKKNGYQAMITMHSWMFLSSYEKLRAKVLYKDTVNMAHLGARAFEEIGGEVVQTTAWVMRNSLDENYKGIYCRLIEPNTQQGKEDMFFAGENRYSTSQSNFSKIPGIPIAYWVKECFINYFSKKKISDIASAKSGMTTTDNERFLRLWQEVNFKNIGFHYKEIEDTNDKKFMWYPFCKGGEFRRWYGNLTHIVNWYDNGKEIRKAAEGASGGRLVNIDIAMEKCLTWTKISSSAFSLRKKDEGIFFSDAAPGLFCKENDELYMLALLNSKVAFYSLNLINPTLNFVPGAVSSIPIIDIEKYEKNIKKLTDENCIVSKTDWDSYETSWDFTRHPLIAIIPKYGSMFERGNIHLDECYECWKNECNERFAQLKANEDELNRIFIDIYGLNDELTPEVEDKDVTVHFVADTKEDAPESMRGSSYLRTMQDEIKSLISYAVGCMLGRYSPEKSGLVYAGGEWDSSKYPVISADEDNCIIISDDDYFSDDITSRFISFIETIFGEDSLEHNLQFIAEALGNKGSTSREIIRNYFLNDFFKDHCQTYSVTGSGKRPIYWLFDSGKNNGFKALVYMHRWNTDTVGNVRVEYLHKVQKIYENEINRMQDTIDNSGDNRQISQAIKRKEKLVKQLKETQDYDERIAHIALSRIDIDLDDGVKYNYRKVQTDSTGKYCEILADSKNIMMKEEDFKKFKKG